MSNEPRAVPNVNAAPLPPHAGPCTHLDPAALDAALAGALGDPELHHNLRATHPHLFSASSVFVRPRDLEAMAAVVRAVESVVARPAYRAQVLEAAPSAARHDPRVPGVFLGYDFHIAADGPRLIEINTNAGGALLVLALTQAHLDACPPLRGRLPGTDAPDAIAAQLVEMFRAEWRAARGAAPLGRVAIVDDDPAAQYLQPEFTLFERLFRRHGIEARTADARALEVRAGRLAADGEPLDLVYNRLTDFALEGPAHAALRQAYLEDLAVVTPHPRAHALYADKHNLALLTDAGFLRGIGVGEDTIAVLAAGVARTRRVEPAHAETLWSERKRLFFKPVSGYGSKAVYRGDKLTRRVWEEILAADYVAQELVPPAEQHVPVADAPTVLKYDVRNFVYAGRVQLLAARLYQGQTTNFRTPGGGFAPVFRMPERARVA